MLPSRILIAGIPRAGKTTFANALGKQFGVDPWHNDDLIGLGWSESSLAVAGQICSPGPWIIEGVTVPRALRKWLATNEGAPADVVYWLGHERIPLSRGQTSMANGCCTVWAEILPALALRGVKPLAIGPGF